MGVINISFGKKNEKIEKFKECLSHQGYLGSLLLGIIFSLAFCPYSGVLFFGVLMPIILTSREGLILAPFFALGTGLPVLIFSFLIAFSLERVSKAFKIVQKTEKIMRYLVAFIFMLSGLYYSYFLIKFLLN